VAAYVYVSNNPLGDSQYQITAYSVDTSGQLTPLAGSPFKDSVRQISVNGVYLLGDSPIQEDSAGVISNNFIDAFKIGSDGALTPAAQTDMHQFSKGCGSIGQVALDRTGQTLFAFESNHDCSGNHGMASFSVDPSTGSLSSLGSIEIGTPAVYGFSVSGDNKYAYALAGGGPAISGFFEFQLSSNGLLRSNSAFKGGFPPSPGPPPGATGSYHSQQTAADSANHVVVVESPVFSSGGPSPAQTQLATYTVGADGNLTTTDTYATMPAAPLAKTTFTQLMISPSNKFLAVADRGGLQIFHFNGANPITSFTDLLTTDDISEIAWDKHDHLYAITRTVSAPSTPNTNANKLYVFTVTDSSVTQSPGSPYTITFPAGLAVQSQ
jgi:6-phosphogluconolactonase (cycloisomerase 2 family)